ncbi:phage holin family protein [Reichenbachiella carrageenanivorans]|uniref:Phage holin family protein n=1 Tax=Reichenbachiella carrageenanivorans TaxID=2979869 RepID=A0ABY6D6Q5_9BACT|nr:phage holin family protein [Reichenbachiella carrageenanivorans]UXX80758.1 phage holin family protein [Reichenbachiella carrageenanivorans]
MNISKLKETFTEYLRVKFELFKLDLTEHLSNLLAQMIAYLVILVISGLMVTFLSIALANFLNSYFPGDSVGYLIVSGLYLLLLLLVFYFLKSGKLKVFFETKLMENITKEPSNKDEQ